MVLNHSHTTHQPISRTRDIAFHLSSITRALIQGKGIGPYTNEFSRVIYVVVKPNWND
jgi:hypothetical protein